MRIQLRAGSPAKNGRRPEKKRRKTIKNFKNLGLNPALSGSGSTEKQNEESPVYLAHMLEHDYLVRKDKDTIELGGVVIGLALNSVYYYRENVGDPQKEVTISDKKLRQEGEKNRRGSRETDQKHG